MNIPLSLNEIGFWMAVISIILLIISELSFSSSERINRIVVNKIILRYSAVALGFGFIIMAFLIAFLNF